MKKTQTVCPECGNTEISKKMKSCPNCGKKLGSPVYKKWWFWVIIVLGVLIIGGAGTAEASPEQESSSGINNSTAVENHTAAIENNTQEYTKVDLQQMLDELKNNALKAEKTYNNTYVQVTGKIAGFDSDGSYITIEPVNANEWNFETVMCYIKDKEQLELLLEKSKGDTVTIQGKITSVGEVLGYSLKIDSIE